MKRTIAIRTALGLSMALGGGLLSGCGGRENHAAMPPPPGPSTQALDTAQALTLAQQSSETSSPFKVADGALTLTDTSETSEPIAIAVM